MNCQEISTCACLEPLRLVAVSSVVVITGAGASFDCVSGHVHPDSPALRPPLTKDLFSTVWKGTLENYPLARQAAAGIRQAMSQTGEDAIALEDYLRERMATSESPHVQRCYRQVPLYLQDVLSQASSFTRDPDNYNLLVTRALEMDDALFLTLNYDTLLDSRFAEYTPLVSGDRDWYVSADSRWSLIKLHGSVNWGWRLDLLETHESLSRGGRDTYNKVIDDYVEAQQLPAFENDRLEVFAVGQNLDKTRWDTSIETAVYYPALALPLGPGDELVCPSTHLEVASETLKRMDGLNILVIGYSGLDERVLQLLSASGNSIRRLLVANGDATPTRTVENIATALEAKPIKDEWASNHDFSSLVRTGTLDRWMNEVAKS